jgi:hypothetical protein
MAVSEQSPAAMGVRVNTGKAFIQGYYLEVYASQEALSIAAADPTNARIDRVVARRDLGNRQAVLAVLTGTPSGSPVAPALTQNPTGVWEIPLAQVLVPAAAATIVNANITDERGARAQGTDIATILKGTGAHAHTGIDGGGTKIDWANILSKPTTFTPSDHTHTGAGTGGQISWTNISSKPTLFEPEDHTHASAGGGNGGLVGHGSLSGVTADQHHAKSHAHDGADGSGTVAWGSVTGKPTTFAPTNHASAHAVGGSDPMTAENLNAWEQASAGGGAAGIKIWVGTTTPSSGVTEGDIWVKK